MTFCNHIERSCINPYELIRKYLCLSCGGVMICECDKEIALRFLPYQINEAHDLHTKKRIRVTLGFQKNLCNFCRNIPKEASPKAELYGAKSKIKRYYWREIHLESIKRFEGNLGTVSDFVTLTA